MNGYVYKDPADRNKYFSDILGKELWDLSHANDNSAAINRLRKALPFAIAELSEKQRKYINMYYFDGLTMGQIVLKYGVNQSTVSRVITRAKKELMNKLKFILIAEESDDDDD